MKKDIQDSCPLTAVVPFQLFYVCEWQRIKWQHYLKLSFICRIKGPLANLEATWGNIEKRWCPLDNTTPKWMLMSVIWEYSCYIWCTFLILNYIKAAVGTISKRVDLAWKF